MNREQMKKRETAEDRARALRGKISKLPIHLINLVGSFLTDTWTPLPDLQQRRLEAHVARSIDNVEYPDTRLDIIIDQIDLGLLYTDPWGERAVISETGRRGVYAAYAEAMDMEEQEARHFANLAQIYDTYRWLERTTDYSGEQLRAIVVDEEYATSGSVVLPNASHILKSRPDPIVAVLNLDARKRASLIETVRFHRWNIITLKAIFIAQLFTVAEASRYDSVVDSTWNAYRKLAKSLNALIGVVVAIVGDLVESWSQEPSYSQQVVELVLVTYVLYHVVVQVQKKMTPTEYKILERVTVLSQETRFVKREYTPEGWFYEFIYKGETVRCLDRENGACLQKPDAEAIQDEMALPGSSTYPSKKQPVGAIFVATADTELVQVGCFWRCGDELVTARHVASAIDNGVATAYLAGITTDSKNKTRTAVKSMLALEDDFFSEEHNICCVDLDIFTRTLTAAQWSKLPGVTRSSIDKRSQYNQVISAVGYHGDLMVTAAGKTMLGSGPIYLWHTASTQKGFSGSPIFSGNNVVGMHIQAHDVPNDRKNIAIRSEVIKYYAIRPLANEAQDYTSDSPEIEHDQHGFKFMGHRATIEQYEDEYIYLTHGGQSWIGYSKEEIEANNPEYFNREAEEDEMDRVAQRHKPRRVHYEDEGVAVPALTGKLPSKEAVKPIKFGLQQLASEQPVYCARTEPEQPEAAAYLDKNVEELSKLGYDAEKYVWPDINKGTEVVSLVKHLQKFVMRTASVVLPPTQEEKDKVVAMVLEQMGSNKYEPSPDYKTTANIKRVLDSQLVKDSKSPGHPYQGAGLATNGKVLENYTPGGFADVVVENWDSGFDLKVFLKGEPTKKKKIDEEMPRVITGMPLHKMVKHQAIFEKLVSAGVEHWGESAIVGGFSPVVGGHIQNLANRFKGRKVYGSDKPCWDYMYHKYLFDILEEVLVQLPVRTDGWSEETWDNYLGDIRGAVREVSTDARYRCSDGTVWTTSMGGAMKSGWVLTFLANSIGQLIVDALIKTRMGVTVAQSTQPEYAIMVGGDDVLQTFPEGFDLQKYKDVGYALGIELEDFVIKNDFNGVEFFSHEFELRDGVWQYHPTRFTKHVAKMRRTKLEHLPDALVNHMRNHLWNARRYNFLEKMYRELRKEHPTQFPLSKLKSKFQLQMSVTGREASC